jgi:hypothetical protein
MALVLGLAWGVRPQKIVKMVSTSYNSGRNVITAGHYGVKDFIGGYNILTAGVGRNSIVKTII